MRTQRCARCNKRLKGPYHYWSFTTGAPRAAPGGKAAADILKSSGLDFYEWQNTDRGTALDLSALKGGD